MTLFERLAVLYAVESAQPAVSETKLAGLVAHYGIGAEEPGAAYFALHAERDLEHAEESRAVLAGRGDRGRRRTSGGCGRGRATR